MPFSKLKGSISDILVKEGYIASWTTADATVGKSLVVKLKYGPNRERSIAGVRRVSKPGPAGVRALHRAAQGARRAGRRHHLDLDRSADRPSGRQEEGRRGSSRLRLVGEGRHVTNRTTADSRSGGCRRHHRRIHRSPSRDRRARCSHVVVEPITVAKDGGELVVTRPNDERDARSRHGLTRTLVNNMVVGVTQGYTKSMEIVGVGYRVAAKGSNLEFALGYSHPVPVAGPARDQLRRRVPDQVPGRGHRQAAGRRGRREHPQAPQARPVQGQGRAVRRRGRQAQGRKDR